MKLNVKTENFEEAFILKGRTAWAFRQLVTAGFKGIIVETAFQERGGYFRSRHGRHVLHSFRALEPI
ncbi:MAG: hypothetical protein JXR14_05310 [Paracoccaceae bacterium]